MKCKCGRFLVEQDKPLYSSYIDPQGVVHTKYICIPKPDGTTANVSIQIPIKKSKQTEYSYS